VRVGIIVDNPINAPLGYSIRPRELSANLAKLGCEVYVFSPVDKNSQLSENYFIKGIPNWQEWFTTALHKSVRRIFKKSLTARYLYQKKVLETLSERLAERLLAKVKDCNIDILQGETEIASMAAIIIGKRLGIPAVADIHGLLVGEAVQYGFLKEGSKAYYGTRDFASMVLHEADAVLVVSENLANFVAKDFSLDISKIFNIPNAATPKELTRPLRPSLQCVVYAGILEPWERVDLAVASMQYVIQKHEKAVLQIAGGGSLKGKLVKTVKRLKLNRSVYFKGTIAYPKVAGFLAQGDIAVLPSTVDIVRTVACPIKLYDYLASGLPVVTVTDLWWADFVKSNNVGLVAKSDSESYAFAISELLSSPDKTNKMSENAVRLVKDKYNWLEMSKNLIKVYERVS
jgi:glycosyltransferase involved in cell wall biosynthesis